MDNDFNREIYSGDFHVSQGVHLIEASAGTGKTYNIQNIYARLIMETESKVSNILVMTYTEAATKELRERLHAVLQDLQMRFAGTPLEGKHKEDREERADRLLNCLADRDIARQRVELALLEFDGAAISTIHGFCQRVLTRFAFETGMSFSQEVSNNKDKELKARAEDWWRIHKNISLTDLQRDVKMLGAKTDYIVLGSKETLQKTIDFLTQIERKYSQTGVFPNCFEPLRGQLRDVQEDRRQFNELDMDELLRVLQDAKNNDIRGAVGIYDHWNNLKTLLIADEIVAQYEKERFDRESLNFDDLLRALRDALLDKEHGKALADALREEYQAALIDEFQDTDPVQFDIFKCIFLDREHPGPLYFVGDPKQAIYAFRGGDIYTYFTAAKTKGLQRHIINVNHRSTKRLVDAVNAMFQERPPDTTFGNEEIVYTPSVVEKEPDKLKGIPLEQPLQVIEFTSRGKSPSKEKDLPAIMDTMAGQILCILNQVDSDGKRIFSPKDIAVLLSANADMPTMQRKLLAKGIPCVIKKPGNVFSTPIAAELNVFLQSVAEAGMSSSGSNDRLRAALSTVFGGMKAEDVSALKTPEDLTEHIERFKQLKNCWFTRGFAALSNQMEQDGYLQRLATVSNGERLLSDIGQIMELCCAATRDIGSTPEALVDWLAERILKSKEDGDEHDSEEYERELETDGEAVKIMTIHSSKGLQFPIVFLPDCWRIGSRNDGFFLHEAVEGKYQLIASIDKVIKEKALAQSQLEKTRLLYVALTRAVQQMVLFTPSLEILAGMKEPLSVLLQHLKENRVENPPYQWIKDTDVHLPEGTYAPEDAKTKRPREIVEPDAYDLTPVRGSFTSLAPGHQKDDGQERDCDDVDSPFHETQMEALHPIFRLPAGARLGTCWHDILEKLDFGADVAEIRRIAEAELLASGFKPEETLDITVKMVEDTLSCRLNSPDGKSFTLREISMRDRLSEQEFDFSSFHSAKNTSALKEILLRHWGNDADRTDVITALERWGWDTIPHGYLTGFMDLIFRHDGYYYIIDWKSNSLERDIGNFTVDGIRAEMARQGYFLQYMLYASVLHQYLRSRLGGRYSWEWNFGGVRYYFLRGIAAGGEAPVFEDRPSEALLDEFSKALGMELK